MRQGGAEEPPQLLDLPQHLVCTVLSHLGPLALNIVAQTCTALLRCATEVAAARPPQRKQHAVQRAAAVSLASVLHLPPAALHVSLNYRWSERWPLSLAMEGLRRALAARDVSELAEGTAAALHVGTFFCCCADWLTFFLPLTSVQNCRSR